MDAVAELLVKQACAEVITRYAMAVNDWDLDAFVDQFVEDGEWHRPGGHSMHGHAQMRAFMESQVQPGPERTVRHVNGGMMIDVVDEDHATAWSQTTVYEGRGVTELPDHLDGPELVVEYRDRLVRRDGRWRLARRDTTVVFAVHGVPPANPTR